MNINLRINISALVLTLEISNQVCFSNILVAIDQAYSFI
jgi:hypothetical protein